MKKIIFLFVILYSLSIAGNYPELFDKAVAAMNMGQFEKANYMFLEIAKDKDAPLSLRTAAKFNAAECLLNAGEFTGAANLFDEVVNTEPYSNFREKALFNSAEAYLSKGMNDKARKNLKKLNDEYPDSRYKTKAMYMIGQSYFEEGKNYDAEKYLKDAIESAPSRKEKRDAVFSLAMLYERQNDFRSAINSYEELLSFYGESDLTPMIHYRLGYCYFRIKDYDNAILEMTDPSATELDSLTKIEASFISAVSYFNIKDYSNSLVKLNEVINSNAPEKIRDRFSFASGMVEFQNKNYDKAYRIWDNLGSTGIDTLKPLLLFWKAEAKRYNGEKKFSSELFEEFVKLYPDHRLKPSAKFNLAAAYGNSNNFSMSESVLEELIQSPGEFSKGNAFTLLGETKMNKGDFAKASENFGKALKEKDLDAEYKKRARLGAGISAYKLRNYKNASEVLLELNRENAEYERDKTNMFLAESYFELKNYSAALRHYKNISSRDEELYKNALYGIAYCQHNLKDFANAAFSFENFTNKYKSDRRYLDSKIRMADCFYAVKKFDKSTSIYKELLADKRAGGIKDYLYFQFAQSQFKEGKNDAAVSVFREIQKQYPQSKYAEGSQFMIGWINFQSGKYEEAIDAYTILYMRYNNKTSVPLAYYSIGDSYYNMGAYDSAIVNYKKIIDNYPHSELIYDAMNGIQYSYVAKGQPEKAIKLIDDFIANNPSLHNADQIYYKKAEIWYSQDKFKQAAQGYRDFIAKFTASKLYPDAHYWLAKSLMNQRDTINAVYYLKTAADKWMKSEIGFSSVIELGRIYQNSRNYKSAIDYYSRAIKESDNPEKSAELYYERGLAYIEDGNINEAYSDLNHVAATYSKSVFADKAKLELGLLELVRDNYTNALELFKYISENRTDEIAAKAQYYYGLTQMESGNYTDAVSAFIRVNNLHSMYREWNVLAFLKTGDCYVKLKDKSKAREFYNAVISNDQYGNAAKEAKQKLRKL